MIIPLFYSLIACSQIDYEPIDKIILSEMSKRNITGASISLVDSTGIIFSKGYGFADKEKNIVMSAHTVYPFGSITKLITSASILKLQDLNMLNIDSPFVKYVPEFQIGQHFKEKKYFTIADLLMHQAGIPRTRLKDLYTDFAQPIDFYKIIEEEKDDYLIASPANVYQYSDIGMTMLGVLPFRIAQNHYVDFVTKEIFKPLEMINASFNKDSAKYNYTKGYQNGIETKIFVTRFLPAFGMQSSVEDLAKFIYLFLNKGKSIENIQILSSESVLRSIKQQNQATQLIFSNKMGLGWMIDSYLGYQSAYHGGEQKPCLSMVRILPDLKIGIVLAINSNLERDFISSVIEKVLIEILKEKGIPYSLNRKDSNKTLPLRKLHNDLINSYVGDYATSYGIVKIYQSKNKLKVNLISFNKTFSAKIMADSTLQVNYKILGIIPIKVMRLFVTNVGNRKIIGRILTNGRMIFGGTEIKFNFPSTKWESISGKYSISNLNEKEYLLQKEIEVSEYKGIKVFSGEGEIPDVEKFQFCIQPINDSLAIVQGIGGQGLLGETIKRNKVNGEEFLYVCGYRFKKE
jgi:CubicO group peptidase (beta-lactamase class C family)